MRMLALAVPLSALAISAAMVPRAEARSDAALLSDNMCTLPHDDTVKWTPVVLQALGLRVPNSYHLTRTSAGTAASYRAGSRAIGLQIGDAGIEVPETFYRTASILSSGNTGDQDFAFSDRISFDHTMQSACNTMIAGRPVDITTYSWEKHAGPLTTSLGEGKFYLAIARWGAGDGLPTSYIWINSNYKSDLMSLRQVFWTAHFAGFVGAAPKPPACADTSPAPRGTVGEFLDTSVVGMLANSASPKLPKGSGTVLLRFDSTGNVAGVSVGGTLMADAAQKELGAIVGSNVIAQKPGSVTHVRIKVTVGDSALAYSLVGVGNCK
jgi:hypothetical protein